MPDYVEIIEGAPYTVPSDRLLVITALGSSAPLTRRTVCKLLVDSIEVYRIGVTGSSMHSIAETLAVESGAAVEPITVTPGQAKCRAWGRLEKTEQN